MKHGAMKQGTSKRRAPLRGAAAMASLAVLTAASLAAPLDSRAAQRVIENAVNVEDLVATPDGRWVLTSSMKVGTHGGELYAIDAASRRVRHLYPAATDAAAAGGASTSASRADADCRNEVAAKDFAPHGVNLRKGADGSLTLYVVNHGARESVELFSVAVDAPNSPRVAWIGCIPLPPGAMANGVAIGADGQVFVTAAGALFSRPQDSDLPPEFPASGVLAWRKQGGWRTVPSGITGLSNGIVISADGRFLYVADWFKRTITQVDLAGAAAYRTVSVDFMPDNLRWGERGALWVAGQNGSVQDVFNCFTSQRSSCGLASGVAKIEPRTMTVTCHQPLPATPQFSSATTALQLGQELWLGSFRNPSIASEQLADGSRADICLRGS
jgi:hypothetical protein